MQFHNQEEIELVRKAKLNLVRDPESNAVPKDELIAEISRLMPFDVDKERTRKAKRIVNNLERPGKTPANGSLWLPGFEPAPYEPERLISDGKGNTVERDLAVPSFMAAALTRSAENLSRVTAAHQRLIAENDPFVVWAADQLLVGRANKDINSGNFVREKGYWRADPVDPIADDEDEEA
jgi:hypothetical protein